MKLISAFLLLIFCYFSSFAQLVGDMDDESRLYAETKQVNQFFRRFNGEENKKGNRLYSGDRQYRSATLRKSYLPKLFDLDKVDFNEDLSREFVLYVNNKSAPVYLDFHENTWFAQVDADFYYKGELKPIILFLKLEQERLGYKWVISSVYFKLFEDYFINDTTYTKKFLHPMSHELDFMNMRKIFSKSDSVQQYMKKEFRPDYLTMFLYEIKKGNLQFVSVKDLKFHFFQIPEWYFEVSYFNRQGNNTGWLISNLVKYKPEEKRYSKILYSMKIKTGFRILAVFLVMFTNICFGTTSRMSIQEDSTAAQIERVKELITYLEFALNTLGDAYTPSREKDIIITTSYGKFFRDENVQVEDDLDLHRSTVTNKDVQAYLKDVEFFFKNVSFKLDIEDVQPMINDSSQLFYLVKMNRNLNGITVLGDTINESITRYVEINYYEDRDDLKIVSFYTTKLSEKEDLMNWWEELSFEWKYIFQQRFNYYDSVGYEELKVLIEIDSLDLSSNRYLENFEPLFKLNQLRYLNLSNTSIQDLVPLRIHNKLKYLDISDTEVDTLDHIKYAADIEYLDLSELHIKNLSILEYFPKLERLNLNKCQIDSISFSSEFQKLSRLDISDFNSDSYNWLESMPKLSYLDASFSDIQNLESLSGNTNLETLLLAGTKITDLKPLENLPALEVLNLESTNIQSLAELSGLSSLRKIYCDNSNISNEDANDFMNLNPNALVIFQSEELLAWWNDLDQSLQSLFSTKFHLSEKPSIDELARITKNDSLDLSGVKTTTSLPDLWPFRNLVYLDIHDTFISDISNISQLPNLTYIDASSSNISGIDSLKELKNLNYLDLSATRVLSIESLTGLRGLEYLNIDDAQVKKDDVLKFIDSNPGCLVIYRSVYLINWWEGLSEEWQDVFLKNVGIDKYQIDERTLHIISYSEKIKIDSISIKDLAPLIEFYYLKELQINRVNMSDISGLQDHKGLISLTVSASPVVNFEPITILKQLKYLDISSTGITDLSFVTELKALEVLKVSGTRIKKLNDLKGLTHLKELDISNTGIKSLKPIGESMNIELIICFNTYLKNKAIADFKSKHPECEVLFY